MYSRLTHACVSAASSVQSRVKHREANVVIELTEQFASVTACNAYELLLTSWMIWQVVCNVVHLAVEC